MLIISKKKSSLEQWRLQFKESCAEASKRGHYTRLVRFTREEKKALILKYFLEKNKGAQLFEFVQAFPELKQQDISNLLQELKRDRKVFYTGRRGRWLLADLRRRIS